MIVKPIKTRVFKEGEDIIPFILAYAKKMREKSIVVVTSKIVALSEKRTVVLDNKNTKEKLVKKESEMAVPTKFVWLTIKDGMVMANAGIDESNANGKLILLPKDSFNSARQIRKTLMKKYGLKQLGVLITDSRTVPLRAGVTGIALGYAGFRGIKDYRGKKDIFGRKFIYSRANIADGLAASAVFMMGEGNECRPLAVIREADVEFCDKINKRETLIGIKDDMYKPLFFKVFKS